MFPIRIPTMTVSRGRLVALDVAGLLLYAICDFLTRPAGGRCAGNGDPPQVRQAPSRVRISGHFCRPRCLCVTPRMRCVLLSQFEGGTGGAGVVAPAIPERNERVVPACPRELSCAPVSLPLPCSPWLCSPGPQPLPTM